MFTLVFLLFYAPIETWYSFPELWDPFYLVDFIGILLLVWGAVRARQRLAGASLALLTAGYAWTGANFWRGTFDRVREVSGGSELDYGWMELCFTACVMIGAIAGLAWSLRLMTRPPRVASDREA